MTRYEELCNKMSYTDKELEEVCAILRTAADAIDALGLRYEMVADDIRRQLQPFLDMQRSRKRWRPST